jgi:hypothetical protein
LSAVLARTKKEDTARDIGDRLLAATDGHAGFGVPPHDDRTLVVLRVTEYAASDLSKLPIIY